MCKVYTGYCGTSEIEHGLCACMVDNPLVKAQGLSLRTGAKTTLYLSLVIFERQHFWKPQVNINLLRFGTDQISFPLNSGKASGYLNNGKY